MVLPIFTHGTYEKTIKAIEDGRIKYPGYCWITDRSQYGFINKDNQLEVIGIPELTGTLGNEIILSSLNDGLYQVKGRHKITAEHITTFDCSSNIIVIIQTIDGIKKIRRITTDEIVTYTIGEDLSVAENEVATKDYLEQHDYITEPEVDSKIAIMKAEIESEIDSKIEEAIVNKVRPIVEDVVDESIQSEDNDNIRSLFED